MIRKTIATLIVIAATVTIVAASALAQDPGTDAQPEGAGGWRPAPEARQGRQDARTEERRDAWENFSREFNQAVNPDETQQKQLAEIFREHARQARNFSREHAPAIRKAQQQLQQAKRNQDEEAIKAAQAELDQHKQAREQQFAKLNEQLAGVLNDEQMAKAKPLISSFKEGRTQRRRGEGGLIEQLDLTQDQQAKIKIIRDEAEAQARKTDNPELQEALRAEAREKIAQTVLTDEQRARMATMRPRREEGGPRGPGGDEGGPWAEGQGRDGGQRGMDLGLTEDQQAQRDAIIAEARKQAEGVEDRGERFEIMRQAMRKVHDDVLTDEQRTQIQQQRRERSPLGRLGATEEQHAQAEAIMADAREQAQAAETGEARREIWVAAMKKVNDEVLTEEQRTQAEEMRKQWRERMNQRRQARREGGEGEEGNRPRRRPEGQGPRMQNGDQPGGGEGRPEGRRARQNDGPQE